MGSITLTAKDFLFKGKFEKLNDGSIYLDSFSDDDFNIGCVSKDVFSFTDNKSVVFTFKVDPYSEKKRKETVWMDDKNVLFINDDNKLMLNNSLVKDVQNPNGVKGSKKYYGVLDGTTLTVYSLEENKSSSASASASASGSGSADTQSFPVTIENVVSFDVTDDGYIYIALDKNNKPKVYVKTDDSKNKANNIPDSVNNYKDERKAPIKVAIGKDLAAALLADGEIVTWGTEKSFSDEYKDVKIVEDNFYVLTTNNDLITPNKTINNVAYFQVSSSNDVVYVLTDGSCPFTKKYPVEIFKYKDNYFAALRDSSIDTDVKILEAAKRYVDKKAKEVFNEEPVLQTESNIAIAFGIQKFDLDTSTTTYVDNSGNNTPILKADKEETAYENIARNNKGFILSKHVLGKDVLFDLRGEKLEPFVVGGSFSLTNQLVDFNNTTYKLVVSFTPFGKAIRVFKEVEGNFVEISAKYLSLEEYPFSKGRISVYVKSASSFQIENVEITDELDVTLLPEEIVYRDVDTNYLQTKVSESLNLHTKALSAITNTLGNQANKIKDLMATLSSQIEDLDTRVKKLES